MIGKVLFPVDFSLVSEYAFGNCIPRFFSTGAANELILAHVVDDGLIIDETLEVIEKVVKESKEKLEKIAKELKEIGINTKTMVRIGTPALEIAKIAEDEDVDIIFLPSKGENVLREMLIGTTASDIARAAKKPVLLVKYEWDRGRKSIKCFWDARRVFEKPLIALDFSSCTDKVIEAVKKFEDMVKEGILFHVVDYGKVEETEENVNKAINELEKYEKLFKFPVEKEVHSGIAPREILNTAPVKRATLIVVGKKGKSKLKELLLGSTADTVARNSILPVLIVPCE